MKKIVGPYEAPQLRIRFSLSRPLCASPIVPIGGGTEEYEIEDGNWF